jgi:alpha-L-fucosidase
VDSERSGAPCRLRSWGARMMPIVSSPCSVPLTEYVELAKRFQPRPNAAREWAKLARASGMKDMVMTAKHHEGFCLFDSQLTDYCAPKQGPRRDLVKEYVEAARVQGLRVGLYYSLMDWHQLSHRS